MKAYLVFTTTLSSCAMMAIAGFGLSEQAQAFNISGSTRGTWANPIAQGINTDPLYTGVGTNSFTWGEAAVDINPAYSQPNQVTFTGNSFSATTGSWFKVGDLKYYNGIVYTGTNVDRVGLNLQLSFKDTTNNIQLNKDFSIGFNLINTPNIIQDNLKDPTNADLVEIAPSFANSSFIFGKTKYKFELIGFGQNGDQRISALEGDTYSRDIYARIRPDSPSQNVPEPPTIAASLLVGMYFVYRKVFRK
ncbi:MAG: choice-of-anchor K domain-containing protein [Gloeotrichia echinulata IR180]|jgi:hypothetical protein|nr:choice-of-anchor K domain-containing protein [Gloeotrichia echinulata DEX184]